MSIESVQFVEMIRQAAAARPQPPGLHLCHRCQIQTEHTVRTGPGVTVLTCNECGQSKTLYGRRPR